MTMTLQCRWITLSAMCVVLSAHGQQAVTLKPMPPLAKGIAAFPRVMPTADVPAGIAASINSNLQRRDAAAKKAAKECDDDFFQARGQHDQDSWERTVTVTMKGPEFLSVETADFRYCGGPYPQRDTSAVVYDLSTGKPLDWRRVLPADVMAGSTSSLDGTQLGDVAWAPLRALALKQSNSECRDVLHQEETLWFVLSLDGRTGELVVRIADLPHVIAACGGPFRISAAKAKQLGVSARVTDALTAYATMYKKH